jgi:DNA polymerase-3 subunit gamma/tau
MSNCWSRWKQPALASYQPGRIEFEPTDTAAPIWPKDWAADYKVWTGKRWVVSMVAQGGAKTIAEKRDAAELALRAKAQEHPLVQAVVVRFPKQKSPKSSTVQDIAASAQADALPEVEDEWDPFEEE